MLNPFGPVDNGTQELFGLDYRMAAWRGDEKDPFHTEVGYWLWDAADRAVMRCFVVPRGRLVPRGRDDAPDREPISRWHADVRLEIFGAYCRIHFLATAARRRARCRSHDGQKPMDWAYDELDVVAHERFGDIVEHTDRNRLHRVGLASR